MSRRARLVLFLVAAAGVSVLYACAFFGMPAFGSSFHPYRDHAVPAAVAHATPNVVSAVNYDQRALDTLGEETILLGSVIGAAVLLRPSKEEREATTVRDGGRVLEATALVGYLLLPVTLLIGVDVVVHGHLTPDGGFQGGVVLGTAVHLLYLSGHYRALERVRPLPVLNAGEALGYRRVRRTGHRRDHCRRRVPDQRSAVRHLRVAAVRRDGAGAQHRRRGGGGLGGDRAVGQVPGTGPAGAGAMSVYAYFVAAWLLVVGSLGIVRSANLVHTVVCLSIAQAGTYVLLVAVGYQRGPAAPVFSSTNPPSTDVVDPLVQAMALTDIVVSATVTALLLALAIQIAKRHGMLDPDELSSLKG